MKTTEDAERLTDAEKDLRATWTLLKKQKRDTTAPRVCRIVYEQPNLRVDPLLPSSQTFKSRGTSVQVDQSVSSNKSGRSSLGKRGAGSSDEIPRSKSPCRAESAAESVTNNISTFGPSFIGGASNQSAVPEGSSRLSPTRERTVNVPPPRFMSADTALDPFELSGKSSILQIASSGKLSEGVSGENSHGSTLNGDLSYPATTKEVNIEELLAGLEADS